RGGDRVAHRRPGGNRRRADQCDRGGADAPVRGDRRRLSDPQRTVRTGLGGARMIYDVRQVTTYSYASKVAYAQHMLPLTPDDRAGERVPASTLDIERPPVGRREGHDFFGNRQTWIDLAAPHDRMVIKVAARIVVEHPETPPPDTTPTWDDVRDAVFASNDI